MRSDRDTLDSAGEVGQPPVLFCCSLLMVRGSFLRPYGRIVGADLQPLRPPLAVSSPIKGALWARQRDFITAHSSIMAGFYEPRITNHEPLFFHEPRVIRGDVVILSLLPRSGI